MGGYQTPYKPRVYIFLKSQFNRGVEALGGSSKTRSSNNNITNSTTNTIDTINEKDKIR